MTPASSKIQLFRTNMEGIFLFKKSIFVLSCEAKQPFSDLRILMANIDLFLRVVNQIVQRSVDTGMLIKTGKHIPPADRRGTVVVRHVEILFTFYAQDTQKIPGIGECVLHKMSDSIL